MRLVSSIPHSHVLAKENRRKAPKRLSQPNRTRRIPKKKNKPTSQTELETNAMSPADGAQKQINRDLVP
jgi:hypothetical protein